MSIPFQFSQGEKVTWDLASSVNFANESVTNGNYTCKYYLRSINGGSLTITGTNKGTGWTFVITSTQTSELESGKWQYQAVATQSGGTDNVTLERGVLTVDATLVYTGSNPGKIDLRTDAEKMVEKIEAALLAIVTNKAEEYTIGDRTFKYMDMFFCFIDTDNFICKSRNQTTKNKSQ